MALVRKPNSPGDHPQASRDVTVINKLGVHARPAAMFVKVAGRFQSEILVEKDGEQINGKSIMGLMMLAAGEGSKLTLIATGKDAETAVTELAKLFERKFDEE